MQYFIGRRLTRWCRLVPRVLVVAEGQLCVAQHDTHETELAVSHCMDIARNDRSTLVVVADQDASSAGSIGVVLARVPAQSAVAAAAALEADRSGARGWELDVGACLAHVARERLRIERGAACQCLVIELTAVDRRDALAARDAFVTALRVEHDRNRGSSSSAAASGNATAASIVTHQYARSVIDDLCAATQLGHAVKHHVVATLSAAPAAVRRLPVTPALQVKMLSLRAGVPAPVPVAAPPGAHRRRELPARGAATSRSAASSPGRESATAFALLSGYAASSVSPPPERAAAASRVEANEARTASTQGRAAERAKELRRVRDVLARGASSARHAASASAVASQRPLGADNESANSFGAMPLPAGATVSRSVHPFLLCSAAPASSSPSAFSSPPSWARRARAMPRAESDARLQELLLDLLVVRICAERSSSRFACEMAHAQRRLFEVNVF